MGDDSEWMKLPTEEKCTHKVFNSIVLYNSISINLKIMNQNAITESGDGAVSFLRTFAFLLGFFSRVVLIFMFMSVSAGHIKIKANYLSVYPSVCLCVCLPQSVSVCLSVCTLSVSPFLPERLTGLCISQQ